MNSINNNRNNQEISSINHFNEVPKEILKFIFSFLEPHDKQVAMQVCKKWQVTIIEEVRNSEIKCILAFTEVFFSPETTPHSFGEYKITLENETETNTLKDFQAVLTSVAKLTIGLTETPILDRRKELEAHSNTFFYRQTVTLAVQKMEKDAKEIHLYGVTLDSLTFKSNVSELIQSTFVNPSMEGLDTVKRDLTKELGQLTTDLIKELSSKNANKFIHIQSKT